MVYRNLLNRLFFSLLICILYFITFNNKELLFLFGSIIYLLILYEVFKYFKKYFKLILFYLIFSYFCFIFYFIIFFDKLIFNIFVFTIIFFDSFSYLCGKFFGKNFIFKLISPKKTLEGYLGGILFTNFFLLFIFFFYNLNLILLN